MVLQRSAVKLALALVLVLCVSLPVFQGVVASPENTGDDLSANRYDSNPQVANEDLGAQINQLEQAMDDEARRHETVTVQLEQQFSRVQEKLKGLRGAHPAGDNPGSIAEPLEVVAGEFKPRNWNMVDATTKSFLMIMVSEIGDETFIIAALMAMRHPRGIVLAGALGALYLMTVLSTALGFIVPNLITRRMTHLIATVLYVFFGLRLFYIAYTADPHEVQEEIEEVEGKLKGSQSKNKFRQLMARICTPIFLEAFILTFLAEWGDRSQIATITLAAHLNPWGVTLGAVVGHTICTTIAVLGGRIAAMKISQKTVALCGGTVFLLFAAHNIIMGDE